TEAAAMSGDKRDDAQDGEALWEAVKKSIEPLRKPAPKPGRESGGAQTAVSRPQKSKPPRAASPPAPAPAPALPPPAPTDRRARQKIARGRLEIGARIDLHGMKQSEAKERLSAFLHRAQARGKSLVLVITGKGSVAPEGGERGVLRRAVPLWLA